MSTFDLRPMLHTLCVGLFSFLLHNGYEVNPRPSKSSTLPDVLGRDGRQTSLHTAFRESAPDAVYFHYSRG